MKAQIITVLMLAGSIQALAGGSSGVTPVRPTTNLLCQSSLANLRLPISKKDFRGEIDFPQNAEIFLKLTDAGMVQSLKTAGFITGNGLTPIQMYSQIKASVNVMNVQNLFGTDERINLVSSRQLHASPQSISPFVPELGELPTLRNQVVISKISAKALRLEFKVLKGAELKCVQRREVKNPWSFIAGQPEFIEVCNGTSVLRGQQAQVVLSRDLHFSACEFN